MIQYASGGKESFQGKKVVISGSGNVAQYAALKAIELGATVVSLSDSKGAFLATSEKGVTPEDVHAIADLKVKRGQLSELASTDAFKGKFKYVDGARPWLQVGDVDVALPCATQNEVSGEEAEGLIKAKVKFIAEGSNMGCTQAAIEVFEKHRKEKKGDAIWYAPGKVPDFPLGSPSRSELPRLIIPLNRQSSKRRRCRSLWVRDGTKLFAHEVDFGRGGYQIEVNHGGVLQEWTRDRQDICRAQGRRVP